MKPNGNLLFNDLFDSIPIFTVSEFTRNLKRFLEEHFSFVRIKGEISNLKVASSGHMYFVLKDSLAQIKAVCFRDTRLRLRFEPKNGMEVICFGRINVYEPRGEYQIVVEEVLPHGVGALQIALEELKKKLYKEGLFDESRKKPMPFCPQRIVIVTSAEGAAIRDILKVLGKAPFATEITLIPVQVQGDAASFEIEKALLWVNDVQEHFKWDVLIVGRGGGSTEDLWAFNEERVARALAKCVVPTISAVGHEIDYTISDLVADLRAATPTAAAEWIVNRQKEILTRLSEIRNILTRSIVHSIEYYEQKISYLHRRLRDPRRWIEDSLLLLDDRFLQLARALVRLFKDYSHKVEIFRERILRGFSPKVVHIRQQELNNIAFRLHGAAERILKEERELLQKYGVSLRMLSPYSVLERGYSIVYRKRDGKILRTADDVGRGDMVEIELSKGQLEAIVKESKTKGRDRGPAEDKNFEDAD